MVFFFFNVTGATAPSTLLIEARLLSVPRQINDCEQFYVGLISAIRVEA